MVNGLQNKIWQLRVLGDAVRVSKCARNIPILYQQGIEWIHRCVRGSVPR